jgi:hypothetical protein
MDLKSGEAGRPISSYIRIFTYFSQIFLVLM